MPTETFDHFPGDHASYSWDDPDGAVRLARSVPYVGADIETGSARSAGRWNVKAFSVADTTRAYVLDPARHRRAIIDILSEARRIVFHNGGYDVPALVAAGLMHPDDIDKVSDTVITSRLTWPDAVATSSELGALAERVLGPGYADIKASRERAWKSYHRGRTTVAAMFDTLTLADPAFRVYACFDPLVTARVYEALPRHLNESLNPGLPGFRPVDAAAVDSREQIVNRVLLRRSALGLGWDEQAAEEVVAELRAIAGAKRRELVSLGLDADLGATELKRAVLAQIDAAGRLPATWPRLKNGELTTANTWLRQLEDHPAVQAAHDLLQAERWIKDYAEGNVVHLVGNRVRPQVGVQNTVTGRMTYSSPNLQQLPGPVRRTYRFDSPATSFDWSSIEPVVAAALARDPAVYEPYEAGDDLYIPIAGRAGVDRKTAKTVMLAQLYGQGVTSLAFRLNRTDDEARRIVADVRAAMPRVTNLIRKVSGYGRQYGSIQTVSGRRIPLPPDYKTGNRLFAGYKGVNYLVQGSAYDLLADTIARMHTAGLSDELYLAVHDELVVNTSVADEVGRIMTTAPAELVSAAGRRTVLRVGRSDLGMNWQEKA